MPLAGNRCRALKLALMCIAQDEVPISKPLTLNELLYASAFHLEPFAMSLHALSL
jgi:hypothetical protein